MAQLQAKTFPTMGSGILLGSITGVVKNHILQRLPKDFIKYVYITNSAASVTEANDSDEQGIIKDKPAMSLRLNYDYMDAVSSGDQMPWGLTRIPVRTHQRNSIYRNILVNDTDHLYLTTIDERTRLSYEVAFRLDSETQAYNLMRYLKSYVGFKRPFYLSNAQLEIPMPVEALNMIIRQKGFDIGTEDGAREFHDYLTKWSGGQITRKKNLSSGNHNYFLKYTCNIMCLIPEIPSIEKNMDGKSVLDATVKYSLEVEMINFTNFISEHAKQEIRPPIDLPYLSGDGITAIYNYTTQLHLRRQDSDGKALATTIEFVTDLNTEIDVTSFEGELSKDVRYFLDHQAKLVPNDPGAITDHMKIYVLRDHEPVNEGEDYTVDWTKREVTLTHPFNNYVYLIALYIDIGVYNRVIEARNAATFRRFGEAVKKEI
jgi:hypothetical protein